MAVEWYPIYRSFFLAKRMAALLGFRRKPILSFRKPVALVEWELWHLIVTNLCRKRKIELQSNIMHDISVVVVMPTVSCADVSIVSARLDLRQLCLNRCV